MDNTSRDNGKSDMFLFQYLVVMFQNLALQQMGKLINPLTGELERDLQQARITIDMVQMIKEKTAGNLNDDEQRLISQVLLELQMNYVDEAKRAGEEPAEKADEGGEDEGAKAVSNEVPAESPEKTGVQGGAEARSGKPSAAKPKGAKKASRKKKVKRKK